MTQRIKPKLNKGAIPSVFENSNKTLDSTLDQASSSYAQNECQNKNLFEVILFMQYINVGTYLFFNYYLFPTLYQRLQCLAIYLYNNIGTT